MRRYAVMAAFLLAALAARPSHADVAGPATAIASSSPASGSGCRASTPPTCTDLHRLRAEWVCGRTSAEWLKEHLRGRQVECIGHARDRYERLLAVCYVGGENLNERIVREGWALDFRTSDYLRAEAEARRAGAGI